jgi:hypothetical protein
MKLKDVIICLSAAEIEERSTKHETNLAFFFCFFFLLRQADRLLSSQVRSMWWHVYVSIAYLIFRSDGTCTVRF